MTAPPIFIVGSPRSGTSLLRQMLNRHPALAICYETHFLRLICPQRRRRAFGDLSRQENRERLVNEYLSLRPTQQLGVDWSKFRSRLVDEATSCPAFFTAVLSCYAESQGKERFGDKTPGNAFYLDTLSEWFPGAPILHIVRDPRDVAASLLRMPFGSPSAIQNAKTWLRYVLAARRFSDRPEYLEIRYETLVDEPELELTKICQFIGEDYSPCMLTAEQASTAHPAGWDRYQAPLTAGRLGQWRRQLTEEQVSQIEWAVGPQLEAFGYTREAPPASVPAILRGLSFAAFVRGRRAVPKLPALWYHLFAPREIAKYEYWIHRKAWMTEEPAARTQPR